MNRKFINLVITNIFLGLILMTFTNCRAIESTHVENDDQNLSSSCGERNPTFDKNVKPVLQKYCVGCHRNGDNKIDLSRIDVTSKNDTNVWNPIIAKIDSRQMPPPTFPAPSECEMTALKTWLGHEPDAVCDSASDPGRVGMRRLNRREYNNTVRDLFNVTSKPANKLPEDNVATNFDNNADALGMTAELMELYLEAARTVAEEAIAKSRAAIVTCDPVALGRLACAKKIVTEQGLKIFRRPLVTAEINAIAAMSDVANAQKDTFDNGVKLILQTMLTSPHFLYRVEVHPHPDDSSSIEKLSAYQLATRMAYFIWSSTPDNELLAKAKDGTLLTDSVMRQQIDRMLASSKAQYFADDFAVQWLGISQIETTNKNSTMFPEFDDQLRSDMKSETTLFLRQLFTNKRPMQELITANYSYLNENLANHYGIGTVIGPEFRRVNFNSDERAGFLSQGSFLSVYSEVSRTSIVKRGNFVLGKILCMPPGAPPPEAESDLPPDVPGTTVRQQLEAHRKNPACFSCHSVIDPIGFGLENFNTIGKWQTMENGVRIDSFGQLPDGRSFSGAKQLASTIAADKNFGPCVAHAVVEYALGRSPAQADKCSTNKIARDAITPTTTTHDLIKSVILNDLFRKHRGDGGQQ